jgi:hypothetical protein
MEAKNKRMIEQKVISGRPSDLNKCLFYPLRGRDATSLAWYS